MASRSELDRVNALLFHNVDEPDQALSQQRRIDGFIENFNNNSEYKGRWETEIMQSTRCIAASPEHGTIVYEINIGDSLCTIMGNLHGGAASNDFGPVDIARFAYVREAWVHGIWGCHPDIDSDVSAAGDGWDKVEG
jgi:hypothetical protein